MLFIGVIKNIFLIFLNKVQFSKYFKKNTKLSQTGILEVKNFFSEQICDEIVNYFNKLEKDYSYKDKDITYVKRSELKMDRYKVYDLKMSQFFGIQNHNLFIKKLIKEKKIEKLFLENININLKIEEVSLMINEPDKIYRQPLHVDTFYPTNFKFFIYLTDCSKKEYGPFSYVKKSHLHTFRKVKSLLKNYIHRNHPPQMEHEYKKEEADPIIGNKGDGFMSIMSGVHGGFYDHRERVRYVLVFQLSRPNDNTSSMPNKISN